MSISLGLSNDICYLFEISYKPAALLAYNRAMEIGEQLRKIREARNLSIGGLARKSGVSKTTIYQWEKGKHKPAFVQLNAVLEALNVTYEQLWQDLNLVLAYEAFKKERTDSRDIEAVLRADPDLTPAEIDVIMRIVLSKEQEKENQSR